MKKHLTVTDYIMSHKKKQNCDNFVDIEKKIPNKFVSLNVSQSPFCVSIMGKIWG